MHLTHASRNLPYISSVRHPIPPLTAFTCLYPPWQPVPEFNPFSLRPTPYFLHRLTRRLPLHTKPSFSIFSQFSLVPPPSPAPPLPHPSSLLFSIYLFSQRSLLKTIRLKRSITFFDPLLPLSTSLVIDIKGNKIGRSEKTDGSFLESELTLLIGSWKASF